MAAKSPKIVVTFPMSPEGLKDIFPPELFQVEVLAVQTKASTKAVKRSLKKSAKRNSKKSAKVFSQLKHAIQDADGLITLLTDKVDESLLKHASRLKVVGNCAVGYDNVDLQALARRNIKLVNTPDVLTRATAELTLALLFAAAKRFPEGEALCRKNKFRGWRPDLLLGVELRGRQAVIVGAGRIGTEVARMLRALDMRVEFITRQDDAVTIQNKLRRAQILSLHIPGSPENRHWLNQKKLALLPTDSIVINTARGTLIDEKALIHSLKKSKIFAAALDVYEKEPRIPAQLRKLHNVVLLPHLGSATHETRDAMARLAYAGVRDILEGRTPANLVHFSKT